MMAVATVQPASKNRIPISPKYMRKERKSSAFSQSQPDEPLEFLMKLMPPKRGSILRR